jgi:hypothetical protein
MTLISQLVFGLTMILLWTDPLPTLFGESNLLRNFPIGGLFIVASIFAGICLVGENKKFLFQTTKVSAILTVLLVILAHAEIAIPFSIITMFLYTSVGFIILSIFSATK